jgi:aspartate/methionine/tyrosine aminotransferase
MCFSSRVPSELKPNRLAGAVAEAQLAGRPLIDLTLSNPTRAGFEYPAALLAPLAHPRGLDYAPDPFGLPSARRAVADDYARRGTSVDPGRIVLTASTSEAYSLLFKLLCDAGTNVLVPRPSYPLFEHLTGLDLVTARPYDLEYHGRWTLDVGALERELTPATRAVLMVSPNNPTGSFVTAGELDRLAEVCARRGVAIIADEVFADYRLEPPSDPPGRVLDRRDVLAFSLGGLSKSIGLPQVKLGWIAAAGPDEIVGQALTRLELICDTYLSVSTPAQASAADLLEAGRPLRAAIQARISANWRRLTASSASACRALAAEGGWYGVLQVPSLSSEEDLVLDLVESHGVLVHPGYFFDFPRESFLVLSLLCPEAMFADGLARIERHCDCSPPPP